MGIVSGAKEPRHPKEWSKINDKCSLYSGKYSHFYIKMTLTVTIKEANGSEV